ncbi:MAG: family 20 glycosylhydrolase, partial [Spirochaetales bacterium]|nr:family 20 glycosylhydrolase [Spirochaetales bacterium]
MCRFGRGRKTGPQLHQTASDPLRRLCSRLRIRILRPRFEYRGFLIDVCRHFMPVSELLRIIDLMSLIGFNVFHWH